MPPAPGPVPAATHPAPDGAFTVPVGGYQSSPGGYQAPGPVERRSSTVGIVALFASLVAAVVAPIAVGSFSWEIGRRIPEAAVAASGRGFDTLAFLAPARDQVLGAEVSFWVGTVLGVTAIVMGIIAIARRQGRAQGIAGLVIGIIAPVIFLVVAFFALMLGAAAGAVAFST